MYKITTLEISDITIEIHSNESDTVNIITKITDFKNDEITNYTNITLTIDQVKEYIRALQENV